MIKVKEILRMNGTGFNISSISRSCNCSRNTVKEALRRVKEKGLSWPLQEDITETKLMEQIYPSTIKSTVRKPEPEFDYIHRELKKPNVSLTLLWAEYKDSYPAGLCYSQFCERYRRWAEKTSVVMILHHKPGEELYVDWAGDTAKVIDKETGDIIPAYVYVSSLGSSNYPYAEAFPSQNSENWIQAHINAFQHYQGVPRILVPDNLKTGIKKPCNYDPVENRAYLEMAEYYNTAIVPARVYKPKDKAVVEGSVGDISIWVIAALRNQQFFSFMELNKAIWQKLSEFSEKPFQKRSGSRLTAFLEYDRPALSPLPSKPFEIAGWKIATVPPNYHVNIDKAPYSVPYVFIGRKVDVRITQNIIEIFYNSERISSHFRVYGKTDPVTNLNHMPPNHKEYLAWNKESFQAWASRVGDSTLEIVNNVLASKKVEQQAYKSCYGLMKLADRYSASRLENACKRAISICSCTYTTISNILKNGMDKQSQDQTEHSPAIYHKNIRGPEYYGRGDIQS